MGRFLVGLVGIGLVVWFAVSAIESQIEHDQAIQAEIDKAKMGAFRRGTVR